MRDHEIQKNFRNTVGVLDYPLARMRPSTAVRSRKIWEVEENPAGVGEAWARARR